jgi:hypothetical protein
MNKIFFVALALTFLFLSSCINILGEIKEKELLVIKVPKSSNKLKIVHVPSNATVQSSIQVRKVSADDEEVILHNYDRYNAIDTAYLQSDSVLLIILRDTISYLGNKPDTMLLKF